MTPELREEHSRFKRFVGTWRYYMEASMKPGDPPTTFTGTESARMLGEAWMIAEGEGEMPGGEIGRTMMTLGYDPEKGKIIGTWIGSMMCNMFVYEGDFDASGNVLSLISEGPHCGEPGKTAVYKDEITFESDRVRVMRSYMRDENGNWNQMMTATYERA